MKDLLKAIWRFLYPPSPPFGVCQFCGCQTAVDTNICVECEWWSAIR